MKLQRLAVVVALYVLAAFLVGFLPSKNVAIGVMGGIAIAVVAPLVMWWDVAYYKSHGHVLSEWYNPFSFLEVWLVRWLIGAKSEDH